MGTLSMGYTMVTLASSVSMITLLKPSWSSPSFHGSLTSQQVQLLNVKGQCALSHENGAQTLPRQCGVRRSRRFRVMNSRWIARHTSWVSYSSTSLPRVSPFPTPLRTLAHFISDLPFYSSVALHFAQDMIKVGHRVKVFDGEQQGLVGNVIDISDGVVKVILHTDDKTAPLLMCVHMLTNLYLPSDHVKYWYDNKNKHGIVSAVQQDAKTLTFVEKDTHMVVCIIQLTQHTLISLARFSHTWAPWSHGPHLLTFIVSHWGYGLGSQVQSITGNSSVVVILQRWRAVSLPLWRSTHLQR